MRGRFKIECSFRVVLVWVKLKKLDLTVAKMQPSSDFRSSLTSKCPRVSNSRLSVCNGGFMLKVSIHQL